MKIITHKNLKMNKQIRLTESELHYIVNEAVNTILQEEMEEGTWNNLKTGAKTFFSNKSNNDESGIKGLQNRWKNAKANYKTQGELDDMSGLIQQLSQLLDARKISPQTTVAQLVGGKYNSNKFGTMSGMMNNRKAQLRSRGYQGQF